MQITDVAVKHFRSIKKFEFSLSKACILAGPNSCGKSNAMRAIRFAFIENYNLQKLPKNFPEFITGPAAEIVIGLNFDQPTVATAMLLGIPQGQPFKYEAILRRSGKPKFLINGAAITLEQRAQFVKEVAIVFVPPIRDISSGGLDPLKGLLSKSLKNAKKGQSLASLNSGVRNAFTAKGAEVLQKARNGTSSIVGIGGIEINASDIDVAVTIEQLSLQVNLNGSGVVPLGALGTGHQSQVVMDLYSSLGAAFSGQVIYMFEEPDNHMHPTALAAVAQQIRSLSNQPNCQVIVSSHSPSFIGSFPISDVIFLELINGVTSQRRRQSSVEKGNIHALMATFGLKPIEAMLASSVILVEGATDVSIIRSLSRLGLNCSPDQFDVLVVPCGGKDPLKRLYVELMKLGVRPHVVLDGDAVLGGSQPYLTNPPASQDEVDNLSSAISIVRARLNSNKIDKSLSSIQNEITNGPPPKQSFSGSPVEVIAKASGKINAVTLTQLAAAFSRRTRTKWQKMLMPSDIWVWTTEPEYIFASLPDALNIINAAAMANGLPRPLQPTANINDIAGWLHNRASNPELLELVVTNLVNSMPRKNGEIWEFISYLRNAYS